ncbi:MAG: carbohydrate binding family 9 domain-containing protein [Armatimonadia bacterium]
MRGSGLILLSALVLVTAIPTMAAPLTVTAIKTAAAPVLDGNLDDAVWQQGQWYSNFTLLGEGMKPATAQTRFKVAFDQHNLYFGVELLEPQMDKLVARETQRDGRVHSDDVLEIMVVPNSARLEYYHFSVNPLGTQYDAELRQGGNVRTTEWDGNWEAKVAKGPQAWTVEVALPFVELGLTGASRGDWALNVARERQAGTQELSSFTEGRGGFHQPNLYATLKLPGADLSPYLWTMRPPYETSFQMEENELLYLGKIHLTNDTGRFRFLRLKPELHYARAGHTSGKSITLGLDAGQSREISFSVPVREQGSALLRFLLSDRANPAEVLYVKQVPLTLNYTPLAIDITRPNYRDCIYATQKLDRVEFTVTSALSPQSLEGKQLQAVLLPAKAEGEPRPVAQATPASAAPQVKLSLPADKLAVGDYTLLVTLMDKSGQVVHSAQKTLSKLPPAPNGHEWRFDENNVLLHNGEPYLPFGWFSQDIGTWDPKEGYTALQSYSREYFTDDVVRAWMDPIAAQGTYVTFSPYSPAFMNRGEDLKRPLNDKEREALTARVKALKDHPALLAWYMADEPELVPVLPQRSQEIYETVRAADPYHPCIMLNDTLQGIYRYERGGDVLMPDPYPCFLKNGLAAAPIEKTSNFMETIKDATGGRKPAWVTPQGFNYGDYGRAGNRGPNLTELRNQTYQAVVHGAKGFLWYTYSQYRNYPDLYLGMPFVAREIADLKAAVLAQDVPQAVTVKAPKAEHMHVSLRKVGDELTLFAVNTATEPQEVTFSVKGAPANLFVVSEGRKVSLAGGSFTDKFGIYASHLYSTREALAGREQVSTAQAAIDQANAARRKPGNLAFEDYDTRVVVSSGAQYGNEPDRVLDGVTQGMGWLSKDPKKLGEWLQVIWPAEQSIGRVVAYSTSILEAEVQVPAGEGQWKTVGKLSGQPLTAAFEPVKTTTLRILVTALQPDKTQSNLQEVEAYAK